jgi:hypothetical protein
MADIPVAYRYRYRYTVEEGGMDHRSSPRSGVDISLTGYHLTRVLYIER